QGWLSIPPTQFRLVASLGASHIGLQRLIEWPMLKRTLPGAFLLIFLLCLTSFTVALAVGGGPKATTIELAVYQAFRFDFNIGKAATLGLIQIGICIAAAALTFLVPLPRVDGGSTVGVVQTWSTPSPLDWVWIGLGAAFLLVPLGAVIIAGVPGLWALPSAIWPALWTSLWVAVASTFLCAGMAMGLALMVARSADGVRKLAEGIGVLGLATSPLVIATGLFLMIFPFARPMDWALVVTLAVNAVMSLPFALRVLAPAVAQTYADHDRLRHSVGMPQGTWMMRVVLPAVRRPLGFAMGLAAALSMGDLGVITLFADPSIETLPLAMYRLMGAYRMGDAAGAALVLVSASLVLFYAFDRGGRGHA
ncbi:MAG: thiamine/thiamine pyrophosphate ABC transporter permease ThiP, partial [Pseudomonadota bacterium]